MHDESRADGTVGTATTANDVYIGIPSVSATDEVSIVNIFASTTDIPIVARATGVTARSSNELPG